MITFGHVSDIHGDIGELLRDSWLPDMWVFTGDILPNRTRGKMFVEVPYQTEWLLENIQQIIARLGGRPLLSVPGNHDFIDIVPMLREHGVDAYAVTPDGVTVAGLRFAGFREINYIAGEWAGETCDFEDLISQTFATNPDILVTHAPPAGILDDDGYGVRELTSALCYQPHNIKAHFFGHTHGWGGHDTEEMGIRFVNGACNCRLISL